MRTVNSVTLLGNVVRLPERKITSGGKVFSTLVVATHKDSLKNGEKNTSSEFHNVVAWGRLSNIAENFCKKGRLVYIEGYLKTRSWNHENGAKIFRTEIVASNVIAVAGQDFDNKKDEENKEGGEAGLEMGNYSEKDFFDTSPEDFFEE